MTAQQTAPKAKRASGQSWDKAPFEAAEDRILDASMKAEEPFPLAHLVWCKMQQSAQKLDDGGKFELSRARLALLGGVNAAAIDSILSAFAEVGLIVGGKCETFIPREPTCDQKYHDAKKSGGGRSKAPATAAGEAEAPLLDAVDDGAGRDALASQERREDASARRTRDAESPVCDARATPNRTESESSSSTTLEKEDPPSSSSGEAAGATTTTDGEIFSKVIEGVDGEIHELVIRNGIGEVRKWMAAGNDLDLDIVPELADIAAHSRTALRTLKARFIGEQIAERRARRLAAALGGDPPPAPAASADGAFSRGPPGFYTPQPNFDDLAEREIMGNG